MFVVTVQFEIDPQHYRPFLDEMIANARSSMALEPGCVVFDVCEDPAHEGGVFLYEVYRDQAAFEQHKREQHFLDFDRKVAPWVRKKQLKLYSRVED